MPAGTGRLCAALDRVDWASDSRFASNPARVRHNAELTAALAERFLEFGREGLMAALDVAGVPCAPINSIPDVFADRQVVHRGMLQHLAHPSGGTVPQVISPLRFQEQPLRFGRAPPTLGQHMDEALAELGLGPAGVA